MKEVILTALILFVIILATISCWVFKSSMEANVYTELTGKPVTTYQAMWVDLRVVEPAVSSD